VAGQYSKQSSGFVKVGPVPD